MAKTAEEKAYSLPPFNWPGTHYLTLKKKKIKCSSSERTRTTCFRAECRIPEHAVPRKKHRYQRERVMFVSHHFKDFSGTPKDFQRTLKMPCIDYLPCCNAINGRGYADLLTKLRNAVTRKKRDCTHSFKISTTKK